MIKHFAGEDARLWALWNVLVAVQTASEFSDPMLGPKCWNSRSRARKMSPFLPSAKMADKRLLQAATLKSNAAVIVEEEGMDSRNSTSHNDSEKPPGRLQLVLKEQDELGAQSGVKGRCM